MKGEWQAIPPGVRVLYLPPTSTKQKMQRFEGYARYGLFAQPMLDMRPKRAYAMIDEKSQLDKGVLKFVVTERIKVLLDEHRAAAVPSCDGEGRRGRAHQEGRRRMHAASSARQAADRNAGRDVVGARPAPERIPFWPGGAKSATG